MTVGDHRASAGDVPAEAAHRAGGPGRHAADAGTGAAGTPSRPARAGRSWRRWRRSRPFWGGLLILLAGVEILASMKAPLPVVVHLGPQGLAGFLVPTILILCGLLLWFSPDQRLFYSIVAVLGSLASWVTSNLGGFLVGILLGLVGGSLAFAWSPDGKRRRTATP